MVALSVEEIRESESQLSSNHFPQHDFAQIYRITGELPTISYEININDEWLPLNEYDSQKPMRFFNPYEDTRINGEAPEIRTLICHPDERVAFILNRINQNSTENFHLEQVIRNTRSKINRAMIYLSEFGYQPLADINERFELYKEKGGTFVWGKNGVSSSVEAFIETNWFIVEAVWKRKQHEIEVLGEQ